MELHIELLSDATFSKGEGTPGVVDVEVEHDEYGLPFIKGRTLRGLLRDSWLTIEEHFPDLLEAARKVLGDASSMEESCRLRIGDAVLPATVRQAVIEAVQERGLTPDRVLEACTEVRCQTAEDQRTGAPREHTLRRVRVVVRGMRFIAPLEWLGGDPTNDELCVLALCTLATRHAGLARNRGRGHIRITIDGDMERTRRYAFGERGYERLE